MNTNHHYLRITNQLLFLTLYYFVYNLYHLKTIHPIEYVLASSLVIVIITSQLFWRNPIKGSLIHKVDAFVAKIVIGTLITYTLIYKFKVSFLFILMAILVSFLCSHHYSKKEWCCNKHLISHGILHIFCFIASIYVFLPL